MAHVVTDKKKLLNRVRRIQGQLDGIEKAIEEDRDCFTTLQTLASIRGAIMGLMGEVMEGHMRSHVLDSEEKPSKHQLKAAEEMIDAIKAFLK